MPVFRVDIVTDMPKIINVSINISDLNILLPIYYSNNKIK